MSILCVSVCVCVWYVYVYMSVWAYHSKLPHTVRVIEIFVT